MMYADRHAPERVAELETELEQWEAAYGRDALKNARNVLVRLAKAEQALERAQVLCLEAQYDGNGWQLDMERLLRVLILEDF